MATTISPNLGLRINSGLTSDAKFNLNKIDTLGSILTFDSQESIYIRSKEELVFRPHDPSIGGDGVGGTVTFGTPSQKVTSLVFNADEVKFTTSAGFLDQATGGTGYLNLVYKSDIEGSLEAADKTLFVDIGDANRNLVLSGSLTVGVDLSFQPVDPLSLGVALTLPDSGTVATLLGTEEFENKTIDSDLNTLTNIANVSIKAAAGIEYSKLNLASSIVDADVSNSAAISGAKIDPDFSGQDIQGGTLTLDSKISLEVPAGSATYTLTLPDSAGTANYSLVTDGAGTLSWASAGTGTVTSVDLSMPSDFSISGNPITDAGTLAVTYASQAQNLIKASPNGSAGVPTFRALVEADLPSLDTDFVTEATNLYYTQARFDSAFAAKDTDALTEGSTNKYYSTPLFDVDFATKDTADLAEGTNLYYTQARFDSAFSAKDTDGLSEGVTNKYYATALFDADLATKDTDDLSEGLTNKYYATSLFNTDFATKDTGDLTEGTNLYYTQARFDSAFTAKDTDALSEGVTNKYYATSLFNADLATKDTGDLAEGVNLYYTESRFNSSLATKDTADLAEGTNLYYTQGRFDSAFTAKSTTNLSEGTNLYYTDTRARTAAGQTHVETWTVGTSYVVNHGLSTTDVLIEVYDIDSGETLYMDSAIRQDANNVQVNSSEAPTGSGRKVIVRS